MPWARSRFAAGFFAGLFAAGLALVAAGARSGAVPYEELAIFSNVLRLVRESYVEPVDEARLVRAAMRGMLADLDPHSAYLDAEANQRLREATTGQFFGVGLEIGRSQGGGLQVVAPIEGSPAAKAGLRARDRILELCGTSCESTQGLTVAEAAARLRGPAGSVATLSVLRDGWKAPRAFALTRGVVKAPAVRVRRLEAGIAVARVSELSDGAADELSARLAQLARENGEPLQGLVLDLRDNPGGVVDEAVRVADLWLGDGGIVTTRGRRDEDTQRFDATAGGDTALPLVVLVNGGSASAAEIVAGALQDRRRAWIVGETTYGKGSVQSLFELPGGAGVRLTTARYTTPAGRTIEGAGITPDLPVAASPQGASEDAQLARALDALKNPQRLEALRAAAPPAARAE
jgi:carboxyl-terminal processing protease